MKSHAKAVVIGGGVVGCSVLYHLAKAGWTDIMLIERSELTSGSSWHAAGGFHTLNGDPNVAKLQAYTVQLYKEIEELSGQSCSLHLTGGVMMADTPERMDFLRLAHAKGRYLGMDTELITPSEAKAMFPLMDETNFVGAMWDPVEGHLDPSGTTHAYAKAARKLGAEIVLRNRVVELTQEVDGTWNVVTEQGTVKAEHVVNCGGLWAREIGRMVGVELPVLAMEHMYLLTEPMPEVEEFNKSTGREMIGVLDFKGEIYTRQERNGILLGTYEKACKPWSPVNTPWDFGHELLQPDIDRIAPSLEIGFKHFPGIEKAGIKQIINGPFTFALDGNPLVGPVQGLTNFWCACAVMAGLQPGWRRRPGAVELDGQWRPRLRRLGHGRRPLRRMGRPALHQRQGARKLFAPLLHPLPQRGTAGGAPGADDAALRHDAGQQRRHGRLAGVSKPRSGSRRRARNRRTSSPSIAPMISVRSATRCAPPAKRSASPKSPTSPNMKCPDRGRRISSTG